MIIPVRCFTCNMVLADKYRFYVIECRRMKIAKGDNPDKIIYLTKENTDKTLEGEVLDKLRITNVCCRRSMLTHVDIE